MKNYYWYVTFGLFLFNKRLKPTVAFTLSCFAIFPCIFCHLYTLWKLTAWLGFTISNISSIVWNITTYLCHSRFLLYPIYFWMAVLHVRLSVGNLNFFVNTLVSKIRLRLFSARLLYLSYMYYHTEYPLNYYRQENHHIFKNKIIM